jgi:IS30 family transposase
MSHFVYEQRYTIEVLLNAENSKIEITETLSLDKSIIYKEIRRNCYVRSGLYKAALYHKAIQKKLNNRPRKRYNY